MKRLGKHIERNMKKFHYVFNGIDKLYIPDFIVDGDYVEIKGFMRDTDYAKFSYFPEKLTVITGKDIKNIVKEAQAYFDVTDLREVFGENVPEAVCPHCNKTYKKVGNKRRNKYCSISCGASAFQIRKRKK